jgi:hypothetical protein
MSYMQCIRAGLAGLGVSLAAGAAAPLRAQGQAARPTQGTAASPGPSGTDTATSPHTTNESTDH